MNSKKLAKESVVLVFTALLVLFAVYYKAQLIYSTQKVELPKDKAHYLNFVIK